MEKVNFLENILIYFNQTYLTIKKYKKIFYCDYFILGQIVESSNPPQNVSSQTLKESRVKMVRPRYDPKTSEFKGLYETLGYLVLRNPLMRYSSTTDWIVKNQKFYIHITEGELQTIFPGQFLTVIGR